MKLSEQTGHEVDAYASRQVDNLFDTLTLNESAVLAPMMLHWINLASDALILNIGSDNYEVQRRQFEMQQEFIELQTELLDSRQPKIDALIAAANADEARRLR